VADIVDAVQLAGRQNLEVAVRGGGHNVAGRATIDGGLMIDLSPMQGIHVDAKARTARAQGGATWAEFKAIPFLVTHRLTFDPRDPQMLYMTTFGGGVWKVMLR